MRVVAHRGCPAHGPENTVRAVETAAPHVDCVEVDVRRCGSGELVVFHDETLDRLTGASGAVVDADWATLRELGVDGTDEPIPLLADLLAAVPADVAVNVELKHAGMAADVAGLCDASENDVFVSSFVPVALREVREVQEAADGPGVGDTDQGATHNPALPTALLFDRDWAANATRAADLGCAYLHPAYELLLDDPARVDAAHDAGFAVNAWTVPTREAVETLRSAGVDGVVVDDWRVAPP